MHAPVHVIEVQLFKNSSPPMPLPNKSQSGPNENKGFVILWPFHFTLQSILRQKKNNGNTEIFHHAKT
jgi:hypothetical protein